MLSHYDQIRLLSIYNLISLKQKVNGKNSQFYYITP